MKKIKVDELRRELYEYCDKTETPREGMECGVNYYIHSLGWTEVTALIEALIDYLLEDYDKDDLDYQAAEPFLDSIKKFYINRYRYSYSDFCTWLVEHDMDILFNFANANIVSKDDYDNPNDWEKAKEDALLVSGDGTSAVMSW